MEERDWLLNYRKFVTENGLSEDGEFVIKIDKRLEALWKLKDAISKEKVIFVKNSDLIDIAKKIRKDEDAISGGCEK